MKADDRPINNPEFREHLYHLANEGDRVRRLAESAIEKTKGRNSFACIKLLNEEGWSKVACGWDTIRTKDMKRRAKEIELFWDSVRTLIAAQFSPFSLENGAVAKSVLALASGGDKRSQKRIDRYWSYDDKQTACRFARAFSLLSLFGIVVPRLSDKDAKRLKPRLRSVSKGVFKLSKLQEADDLEMPELLRSVTLLKLVRWVDPSTWRRRNKRAPASAADILDLRETKLYGLLALWLHDDHEVTPAFQVADVVGVLGGRFLNPTLQIQPAHNKLYIKAVQYALKFRSPGGSWTRPEAKDKDNLDPLARRYSPLAYLLDLPNSVLMPCIEPLGDAAGEVLAALRRDLTTHLLDDRTPDAGRVIEDIYNGLMIGAAVGDRLKDLVSDAELDDLKARVPTDPVAWENVSDSLGFRQNLQKEVINRWRKRSKRRPGAILVFGPPGTGKTTIAKALLGKLSEEDTNGGLIVTARVLEDWRFLPLSTADFARDGSDLMIASAEALFGRLQRIRRCVVLLDEMEEFLRARGPETSQESRLITTAFLPLLEKTVEKREIILIVATNFVGTIDPAVTRRGRFDLILPLGPPDDESRRRIIEKDAWEEKDADSQRDLLRKLPRGVTRAKFLHFVAHYTMGYTRDEILDYVSELWRFVTDTPRLKNTSKLETELWRIRQERVPMAMSGNPGCNWRTFRDEAARFKRSAPGVSDDGKYWKEPKMPRIKA